MPSASALSQRRKLLNLAIFKHINNQFVSAIDAIINKKEETTTA